MYCDTNVHYTHITCYFHCEHDGHSSLIIIKYIIFHNTNVLWYLPKFIYITCYFLQQTSDNIGTFS